MTYVCYMMVASGEKYIESFFPYDIKHIFFRHDIVDINMNDQKYNGTG